jgi:hypothetical protein
MPLTRRRHSLTRVLGIDVCNYNIQNCCNVAGVRRFLLYSFRLVAVGFRTAAKGQWSVSVSVGTQSRIGGDSLLGTGLRIWPRVATLGIWKSKRWEFRSYLQNSAEDEGREDLGGFIAPEGLQDSAQGFNPGSRPPRRCALKRGAHTYKKQTRSPI